MFPTSLENDEIDAKKFEKATVVISQEIWCSNREIYLIWIAHPPTQVSIFPAGAPGIVA